MEIRLGRPLALRAECPAQQFSQLHDWSERMKNALARQPVYVNIALVLSVLAWPMVGADRNVSPEAAGSVSRSDGNVANAAPEKIVADARDAIVQLKAQLAVQQQQLAVQQQQIERLRLALEAQQKLLSRTVGAVTDDKRSGASLPVEKLGEVASASPVVPGSGQPAAPQRGNLAQSANEPPPLSFKIGSTYLTPLGFIDVTYVGRSTNLGSGIGTNFAAIPYSNVPQGRLTDGFLSLQNSRIGARFDAIVHGAKVLGYWPGHSAYKRSSEHQ
jgi:hypothetical protein